MTNNNALTPFDFLFGGRPMAPRPSGFLRLGNMATDIYEKDGKVIVDMEIPGADPSSFDITFDREDLHVSLEKRSERSSEDGRYSERAFGTYSRVIHLGDNIDGDAIEAQYVDGVLTVTAPRTEAAQPKRIQVKGAEASLEASKEEEKHSDVATSAENASATESPVQESPVSSESTFSNKVEDSHWDSLGNKE